MQKLTLKQLRELTGKNQTDIKGMKQPNVAGLENGNTRSFEQIERYLTSLGFTLRIQAVDPQGTAYTLHLPRTYFYQGMINRLATFKSKRGGMLRRFLIDRTPQGLIKFTELDNNAEVVKETAHYSIETALDSLDIVIDANSKVKLLQDLLTGWNDGSLP